MVVSLFAILLSQLHQQIAQLKFATMLLCIRGMQQATTASFINEANEQASAVHVVGMPERTLDGSLNGPMLDKQQIQSTFHDLYQSFLRICCRMRRTLLFDDFSIAAFSLY